jgi:plastocyanin
MHAPTFARRFALSASTALAVALIVVACGGGGSVGWTFAPLGPTPDASAPASGAPSPGGSPGSSPAGSPGASPGGSPAGSPGTSPGASGGTGGTIQIATPPSNQLGFEPAEPEMAAGAEVTVDYLNDTPLQHNIEFFAGQDAGSESLGETEVVTGPGALESVTFTAPAEPGDYYFWCAVHGTAMDGIYHVR